MIFVYIWVRSCFWNKAKNDACTNWEIEGRMRMRERTKKINSLCMWMCARDRERKKKRPKNIEKSKRAKTMETSTQKMQEKKAAKRRRITSCSKPHSSTDEHTSTTQKCASNNIYGIQTLRFVSGSDYWRERERDWEGIPQQWAFIDVYRNHWFWRQSFILRAWIIAENLSVVYFFFGLNYGCCAIVVAAVQ